jgi:hypothetical protein
LLILFFRIGGAVNSSANVVYRNIGRTPYGCHVLFRVSGLLAPTRMADSSRFLLFSASWVCDFLGGGDLVCVPLKTVPWLWLARD